MYFHRMQQELQAEHRGASTAARLIRAACLDAADAVGANRTSIWQFSSDHQTLSCRAFYVADRAEFIDMPPIEKQNFSIYLDSLTTRKFILAPDARRDPRTQELAESYLIPNNIFSIMDYVVHNDHIPVGVICCEHAERIRYWGDSDVALLWEVATMISFNLKS